MKRKSLILAALLSLAAVSCSKDEDSSDPVGTVTLHMLNEQNGKTLLGDTPVFINRANNFSGNDFLIANLGRVGGLGAIRRPVFEGLARQVAVEPGHGYLACHEETVKRFDQSGVTAWAVGQVYYRVYVASWLSDTTGATVKYLRTEIDDPGLPRYGELAGSFTWSGQSIRLELPDAEVEYELDDRGYDQFAVMLERIDYEGDPYHALEVILKDRTVTGMFGLYIRMGDRFTCQWIEVL